MTQSAVLCVGRVYCDLVFAGIEGPPAPGREVYAKGLTMHTGGGAAITAHTFARLGRRAELCASLPAHPFYDIVCRDLVPMVRLHHDADPERGEPQITVVMTGQGDRSFVTNRVGRALPDNYHTCLSRCAKAGLVRHLHIAELATLLEYPDLITIARSYGWSVSLDCAWDIDAMRSERAAELIGQVDVFLPNESEFDELQRQGLSQHAAPIVVTKMGERGARSYSQEGTLSVRADTSFPCVDTTGAGDAFNAGYIDAWLNNKSPQRCLQAGVQCGTLATRHIGGICHRKLA